MVFSHIIYGALLYGQIFMKIKTARGLIYEAPHFLFARFLKIAKKC